MADDLDIDFAGWAAFHDWMQSGNICSIRLQCLNGSRPKRHWGKPQCQSVAESGRVPKPACLDFHRAELSRMPGWRADASPRSWIPSLRLVVVQIVRYIGEDANGISSRVLQFDQSPEFRATGIAEFYRP